ncbi:MAG: hypothetical protein OYH76_21970 [Defluviicoccus sp.]|nr:hypothetical protein [Defluviicoccus sp.]MDE0278574.1 hypothetical protein [Defluviicoccus sp.]
MNPFSKLRLLFFGKPTAIQTLDGARRVAFRSSGPSWILGRGLCMYRCEDFTSIPRSRRQAALEFKLPVWSPFRNTGYHAVWSDGAAMVWFWDGDKTARAPEEFASLFPGTRRRTASRLRILPETVFYRRKSDGVHLQACVDGFEIQLWHENVLTDAFWFAEHPQESELRWFLSRHESAPAARPIGIQSMPAPVSNRLVPEPWSSSQGPRGWLIEVQPALATACLFAMVLVVLWQEARYWKIRQLEQAAEVEFSRLQERIEPLVEARNTLIDLRRNNLALLDLTRGPSQAELMYRVDRAIPSLKAEFREWRFQRGELRISVEDRNPDPIAYIRALEAIPLFQRVRAEPGPRRDRLELILTVAE